MISAKRIPPHEALEASIDARSTPGRNLEIGYRPGTTVRASKKMRNASLDLDDESRTAADIVDLIASAASASDFRLAHPLARFAGYHVVEIIILSAIKTHVDAVTVLEQLCD